MALTAGNKTAAKRKRRAAGRTVAATRRTGFMPDRTPLLREE